MTFPSETTVRVKLLRDGAKLPTFAKDGDACADLYWCDEVQDTIDIAPGASATLWCGIAIEMADGWEGVIRGRSGNACGRKLAAHVGTIDSGYRGEIAVHLTNQGHTTQAIRVGDRIGQLAVRPVPAVSFVEVYELSDSARGTTGFGSSGR